MQIKQQEGLRVTIVTAVPFSKCLFSLVQITAQAGSPNGESTFLHLIVRPWSLVSFFQMATAAANWANPASSDLPSYPIQPKQPSHYWLQLFDTRNLIPVPRWRPICEVVWWKPFPLSLAFALSVLKKNHPNWFMFAGEIVFFSFCFVIFFPPWTYGALHVVLSLL